jgi:hypothetical protein
MLIDGHSGNPRPFWVGFQNLADVAQEGRRVPAIVIRKCHNVSCYVSEADIASMRQSGPGSEVDNWLGSRASKENVDQPVVSILIDDDQLRGTVRLRGERPQETVDFLFTPNRAEDQGVFQSALSAGRIHPVRLSFPTIRSPPFHRQHHMTTRKTDFTYPRTTPTHRCRAGAEPHLAKTVATAVWSCSAHPAGLCRPPVSHDG